MPEFYFEFSFYQKPDWHKHTVGVDVLSLAESDFVLYACWGGRRRRLTDRLSRQIEREQDVRDEAMDAYRAALLDLPQSKEPSR